MSIYEYGAISAVNAAAPHSCAIVQDFEGADTRFGDVNDVDSIRSVAFSDRVDVVVSCLASRTGGKVRHCDMSIKFCLTFSFLTSLSSRMVSRLLVELSSKHVLQHLESLLWRLSAKPVSYFVIAALYRRTPGPLTTRRPRMCWMWRGSREQGTSCC